MFASEADLKAHIDGLNKKFRKNVVYFALLCGVIKGAQVLAEKMEF